MTDTSGASARVEALPFLEKKVRKSPRNQVFTALFVTLAVLLFIGGFVAAFLIHQIWPAIIGTVVLIAVALLEPLLDDSRRVQRHHAHEGAAWAKERYGLLLTEAEALELFFDPYDKHELQPRVKNFGDSRRYGSTSTDRYQHGIQLVHTPERGYEIVNLAHAQQIPLAETSVED